MVVKAGSRIFGCWVAVPLRRVVGAEAVGVAGGTSREVADQGNTPSRLGLLIRLPVSCGVLC